MDHMITKRAKTRMTLISAMRGSLRGSYLERGSSILAFMGDDLSAEEGYSYGKRRLC